MSLTHRRGLRRQPRKVQAAMPTPVSRPSLARTSADEAAPRWTQTERWFWMCYPDTERVELVKPMGETHQQGPFEMVSFITQDGSHKACSSGFFEAHTRPWVPGTTRP